MIRLRFQGQLIDSLKRFWYLFITECRIGMILLHSFLEIKNEIEFGSQTRHMDSLEWRQKRAEPIAGHVYEEPYDTSFEFRLEESISREIFCFLTGHDQFICRRFDYHRPENCCFCGLFVETADHLLNCAAFEQFTIDQDTETSAIESRCPCEPPY